MRRTIMLAGFGLLAVALTRPAAAQSSLADSLAKEGKEQAAQAKKYSAAPSPRAYMSGPRPSMNYSGSDGSGRFDMSGHLPPSYFKLRNQSTNFSTRAYGATAHRRPAPSNYRSKPSSVGRPAASGGRLGASNFIPPAPR